MGAWFSKTGLHSFAGIFATGIQQVLDKVPKSDTQSINMLKEVLTSLEDVKKNGDWSALSASFKKASTALSHLNICIHGFNLPKSSPLERKDAEPLFAKNIGLLKEASKGNPVKPERTETGKWKQKKETDALVDNTANFLIMKYIYETICKLTPPNTFYLMFLKGGKENQ